MLWWNILFYVHWRMYRFNVLTRAVVSDVGFSEMVSNRDDTDTINRKHRHNHLLSTSINHVLTACWARSKVRQEQARRSEWFHPVGSRPRHNESPCSNYVFPALSSVQPSLYDISLDRKWNKILSKANQHASYCTQTFTGHLFSQVT